MNRRLLVILILIVALAGGGWTLRNYYVDSPTAVPPTAVDADDPSLFGVFEGRTPCPDCERTKVRLILYQNPTTKAPTTYVLERIYVGKDNIRHITKGDWAITRGTKEDSKAMVYQLNTDLEGFGLYQAADKNILLFLEDDLSLKVGTPGHSYTLSKTN